MGGRQEDEGERAADEKGGEDGEGIRRGFFEQASEACLGVRFQKATPEGEGTSCGGVGEEERDDEQSCFKQEGKRGCSDGEGEDECDDGEGSAVGIVHGAQSFFFCCS